MMTAIDLVRGWLQQLGHDIGFDFFLDPEGYCSFESSGQSIVLSVPPGQFSVHLAAPLGKLEASDTPRFYRKLLALSLPRGPLDGAAFSFSEETGDLVLGLSRSARHLDAQGFKNLLGGFAELARTWAPKITELRSVSAGTSQEKTAASQRPKDGNQVSILGLRSFA